MEVDINKLQQNIEELAEKAGLSETDLEKVQAAAKSEMEKRGIEEDELEVNTLKLVRMKLKKRLAGTVNITQCPGFYISKGRVYDNSKRPRNEAKQYIEDFGLERAVEEGYANPEGEFLYNDYDWRRGQVIPEEDWKSNGLAIIEYNGEAKLCDVSYRGKAAVEETPLFRLCDIPVYMRKVNPNTFDITVSNQPTNVSDKYINFEEYKKYMTDAYPERILPSLSDIIDKVDSGEANEFGSWYLVLGSIMSINTTKQGNTALTIEDISLESTGEDSSMSVFFRKGMEIDTQADVIDATFIVSAYRNQEGRITLNGLGFWVPSGSRSYKTTMEESPDVQETW
jgi:hypothetical protein